MERVNIDYDFCFFVKEEAVSFQKWLHSHHYDHYCFFVKPEDNWEYQIDMYCFIIYNYSYMHMDHVSELLERYRFDFKSSASDVCESQ